MDAQEKINILMEERNYCHKTFAALFIIRVSPSDGKYSKATTSS